MDLFLIVVGAAFTIFSRVAVSMYTAMSFLKQYAMPEEIKTALRVTRLLLQHMKNGYLSVESLMRLLATTEHIRSFILIDHPTSNRYFSILLRIPVLFPYTVFGIFSLEELLPSRLQ